MSCQLDAFPSSAGVTVEAQNCTGVTGESFLPITIRHPVIPDVHFGWECPRLYTVTVCMSARRVTCCKVPGLLQCVTRIDQSWVITHYIAVCTVQTPGCGTSGSVVYISNKRIRGQSNQMSHGTFETKAPPRSQPSYLLSVCAVCHTRQRVVLTEWTCA